MNTIEKLDKLECCGCGACFQKCPQKAILMKENEEGFLYPIIDKEKCINCGLCEKICPQFKKVPKKEIPQAYAVRNKNLEELKNSSSGGFFIILANYVIENNGVVFGAAYDENLNVNHIKIKDKENLKLLQGSKYVQSNINNTYKEAEKELKENKMVLFSGTPCQIAGLNSYLVKDYDNLITCDLVCHGVPSQKLFKKYIEFLSEKFKSKIVLFNYRNKEKQGWDYFSKIKIKTIDKKVRYLEPDFDPYYFNFLSGTISRECCYRCHYSTFDRVANITLGDYWGIHKIHPKFYSPNGNSLILINDNKGQDIFDKVKDKIELLKSDIEKAAKYNKNLEKPIIRKNIRDTIYYVDKESSKNYIKNNLKVRFNLKKIIKLIIPTKIKRIIKKWEK